MSSDTMTAILYICTAILTVGNAGLMIASIISKVKAPNKRQDERITSLETRMDQAERHLDSDNKKISALDQGDKVTQKALLALMSHALNEQDDEKLRMAKKELENYLIDR